MTIVHTIGARPNMVKMALVIAELRRRLPSVRYVIVHTGHYDREASDVFFEEVGVPEPDHPLGDWLREPCRSDGARDRAAQACAAS